MRNADTIEGYFANIRAKDIDGLMALYAEDAVFCLPNGREFHGKDAIRQTHASVFASGSPFPTPHHIVMGETAAAVEIEARLPDGTSRYTTNVYSFDDAAKITRLSVYTKV